MRSGETFIEAFGRVQKMLHMTLKNLTPQQLTKAPAENSNPIGWLAWHLTRTQDSTVSRIAERDQAWTSEGWYAKFGMNADPAENGHNHTWAQVTAFQPGDVANLLSFHDAVFQRSKEFFATVNSQLLDESFPIPGSQTPGTKGLRLVGLLNDNLQHVGQIAYLRGLLENRHWFPA